MEEKGESTMPHADNNRQSNAISENRHNPRQGGIVTSSELSARAAQRLSALGEMTAGIAHDFRNMLSVIDAGLRLAESNSGNPDKVRAFIAGAREAVTRGSKLTSGLLTFAQQGVIQTCVADANLLLRELAPFLKYGAGPSVRVILDLSPNIPKCPMDSSQFAAAVLNLVVNARDAMPSGGEVRIYTTQCRMNQASSKAGDSQVYVRVRVQDNGPGMPDHVVQRVFEPFFTTKGEKGTGLGIPHVHALMRQLGGHIDITSQQGRGTTVDLCFPALTEMRLSRANPDPSSTPADNVGGRFLKPASTIAAPPGFQC
jgi:signal transduction histidine kinase